MTDSNLPKKKKKVTFTASEGGIEKAENALKRLGFESKSNFAKSQLISRSTVTKFFQGEPIQLDSLKRICDALDLSWKEVMGMLLAEDRGRSLLLDQTMVEANEMVGKRSTLRRQVTVVDSTSEKVKSVITIEGDVDSVDNWRIFQLILRQHSGSSINIVDIESGSIRLIIDGSHEDIQKLIANFMVGKLTELDELPIRSIQILTENLDIKTSSKWDLVKEIVDSRRTIIGADLSNTDLSDTDLSGANLIGANLSGTDLSGADLSDANLSDADLSSANLSGAHLGNANLGGANLISANLSNTHLAKACLIHANLSKTNLSRANLSNTYLTNANLRNAYLSNSSLFGAHLNNAELSNANLSGADLNNSCLIGSYLTNADLSNANLRNADLGNANLSHANLSRANLSRANLFDANLSCADVQDTRFGYNTGISESMKIDLENRGAIFEDSSGDRSETYAFR
jgi:uncharacterized protein YjbI with pentapeptide repeats/predicted transcriptional regulator